MKHFCILIMMEFSLLLFGCAPVRPFFHCGTVPQGDPDFRKSYRFFPANHSNIQYFGRWDTTDPRHPRQSWPGVYFCVEFTGTGIGLRIDDNINYYNIYVDGQMYDVFHGDQAGEADYWLAKNLENGQHKLRLSKRNIAFDKPATVAGLWLEKGAKLLLPHPQPTRKIEFIGDSFTAAEGNEAIREELPWEEKMPVTNIDLGFAVVVARHFEAQYHTTCRSGMGLVCDWTGNHELAMPRHFDRTLMVEEEPKWDFRTWLPDLVVICLGLNDYSGFGGWKEGVAEANSALFRKTYHDFLATIRKVYPGVKILAVAAHPDWIRANVLQVVNQERADGRRDVFYARFDYFTGGYVANGHPTVATHRKIAGQIIAAIEAENIFK